MKLTDYLKDAPIGARKKLARAVGIAPTYLYQIENELRPAPIRRIMDLCKATDWTVTPHELRPDIYPNPDDGLPVSLRAEFPAPEKGAA